MGKQKKKGDSKALTISHPNSRKAKSLAKKVIKASTRQKTKTESAIKRNILFGEKLMWFKENLEDGIEYSGQMLDSLFEKYLARFDDELEQIAIKHSIGQRKGRQHASREDIILMTKKREHEEYNTCGIEMVDILNPKQLKLFREWGGNLGVQFKIRRFSKSYLLKYKPPNQTSGEKEQEMTVDESDGSKPFENKDLGTETKECDTSKQQGEIKCSMEVENNV